MEKHIWFAEFVERCGIYIDGAVFIRVCVLILFSIGR